MQNDSGLKQVGSNIKDKPLYLDRRSDDWRLCLDDSLRFLFHAWQTDWVGLPALVESCINFLKLNEQGQTQTSVKLLAVAQQVAVQIEADCNSNFKKYEPQYHNRLHFACVLTTLTLQIAIESERCQPEDSTWPAALILIALTHDLNHTGRVNQFTSEIEQLSFNALHPYLQEHDIPIKWVERIQHVILLSDFLLVKENHNRIAGEQFSWNIDWAVVLLNESDIMISVSEEFGPGLGLALAKEWKKNALSIGDFIGTQEGRKGFLKNTTFSSDSAIVLGAVEAQKRQLNY